MKVLLIFLCLFLSFLVCQAQWDKRADIEFSAGPSWPVGDFGNALTSYENSGYAENGVNLALSFNYRLNGHLGLVASVSEQILGVDEMNMANHYWIREYGWDWTRRVESTRWLINAYLGGVDIILPLYKSDFHFRLQGGFAATRLPALTEGSYDFRRDATRDLAAALGAGAGFTFQYYEKITLSFLADILISNPILDEVWTSSLDAGSGTISQNIILVNLRAGIGFRIF